MGEIMDTTATGPRGFPFLFYVSSSCTDSLAWTANHSDFCHQPAIADSTVHAQLAKKPPTLGAQMSLTVLTTPGEPTSTWCVKAFCVRAFLPSPFLMFLAFLLHCKFADRLKKIKIPWECNNELLWYERYSNGWAGMNLFWNLQKEN